MNTNFKMCIALIAVFFLGTIVCQAQNVHQTRKYRVIAYKKGDNSVFSVSNTTELAPNLSLYVPNSFTPNGDGLNDTFGVYGESIKNYRMQVFNRWGQVIFESNNVTERWDGTYNGQHVPQGAYVYKMSANGINGNTTSRNGTLNIIY